VTALAIARKQGQGWKLAWVEYALCVLELSLGRYQEALARAPTGFEENLLARTFALPDFIEAAVRCSDTASPPEALGRLADQAPTGGSPLAAGLLARSRALLAADHEAEALEDARTRRPAAQAVTPADGAHGVSPALVGAARLAS